LTIRAQLLWGFCLLIAIFLVGFFVNQGLSRDVSRNTTYITNSETVIRNSNVLHKEMIEMQSSFRGFLLTSQDNFLVPFYAGMENVPVLFQNQRTLVSSQAQKLRLDSIYALHQQWAEYATSLIITKKDTLPEASKKFQLLFEKKLRMEVGKKLNDKIRVIFHRFDEHEYHLRQLRREVLQASVERTKNFTIALTLVSIALALVLSWFFVRSITARIQKMVDLARKISDGSFITIQDEREDELSKLVEALNKMSGTLNRSFMELSRKNSELDQFAYVVSHDLKAPIRGISNIISWLEEDYGNNLDPGIHKHHMLIKGRIFRLESMINGMLEYARIGRIKRGKEPVGTSQLVDDLVHVLVPRDFEVSIDENLPVIETEKILLEQVFSNLLSNAVKYNDKSPGRIEIRVADREEMVEFSVIDNGLGIDKSYFDKIFVIFQTLQERDAFESTGVGLAIVAKIIEEHKGKITVESQLGQGSKFTFTWPK
jgi:signal transduction histidine kinase